MTTPLPPPPPVPPRLSWVPTLDGLRGLAVLAVVAFHAGHLQGGYLGVDLFFTVSGFLITRLILDDLSRRRFSLGSFWARRARRLLPRAVAAPGRPHPLLAVAGRAQLRRQPAPLRGRDRHLHRQLVAALRPRLLLAGLRHPVAPQPHVEPRHRGAVLRDLADRRPGRLEGRQATGPGAARRRGGRHHRLHRGPVAALQAGDRRGPRLPRHGHPGGLDPRRLRGRHRPLDPQPPRQTRGVALAAPARPGRPRRHRRRLVRRPTRRVALPRRLPAARDRRRPDPGQQRRADAQPAQPGPRVGAARADRPGQLRHLPVALAGVLAPRAGAAARAGLAAPRHPAGHHGRAGHDLLRPRRAAVPLPARVDPHPLPRRGGLRGRRDRGRAGVADRRARRARPGPTA